MPRQAQPTPDAYTVDSEAPAGAVASAYRGVLGAMRSRIADFSLDLISDRTWPADVEWAVEALTPRRPPRTSILPWVKREPSFNIDLDLRKDEDFQLAVALAPYTINGEGRADDTGSPIAATTPARALTSNSLRPNTKQLSNS